MATGRSDIRVSSVREDSHGQVDRARFERALDAAHSLCDVLWEELHDRASTPRSVELAERIADAALTVALLARAGDDGGGDGDLAAPPPPSFTLRDEPAPPSARRRPPAVLIDERDDAAPAEPWWASGRRSSGERAERNGRAATPAWLEMVEGALAQFELNDVPFELLLVEAAGSAARVPADDPLEQTLARTLETIAPASIAREDSQRCWVLVPRTDRTGANVVADRLADAFAASAEDADDSDAADRYFAALAARGSRFRTVEGPAPVRVVIGTAACPRDGSDVRALVAHAHIELARARSASRPFLAIGEPR